MGKRYKKGNVGRTRHKKNNYIRREKRIGRDIKQFKTYIYEYDVNDTAEYKQADRLRNRIKYELKLQGRSVEYKSRQRRFVYYQQVSSFKGLYVTWKKLSLQVFLNVRYNIPVHLIPSVGWYYINIKKGVECSLNIF